MFPQFSITTQERIFQDNMSSIEKVDKLALDVSNTESMTHWAVEHINSNQCFSDFLPLFEQWLTINDIKEMLKNKVRNARSNPQIHLMRSMFVKIAPVCDVLPNDVMVKIIKYLYSDKNWSYFPLISKSFKNIMYSNGTTLYNDYTIVTRDDAMPCTLENGNDILKLHISHETGE